MQIPQLKRSKQEMEQYILQEVKPWKLGMHAQLIPTHRQFKVQYSTYATHTEAVDSSLTSPMQGYGSSTHYVCLLPL